MKQTLFFGHISLFARSFLSPQALKLIPYGYDTSLTSLLASPSFKLRLFSSKPDSFVEKSNFVPETKSHQTQEQESSTEVEDVSNEEKYFEGDEEVVPIFEAILKRKLAGKHDDSDDELLEEFGHKPADDVCDEEFDSEEDE